MGTGNNPKRRSGSDGGGVKQNNHLSPIAELKLLGGSVSLFHPSPPSRLKKPQLSKASLPDSDISPTQSLLPNSLGLYNSCNKNSQQKESLIQNNVHFVVPNDHLQTDWPDHYQLCHPGLAPIVVQGPSSRYYTGETRSKWRWEGFYSPCRQDNLILHRWRKQPSQPLDEETNTQETGSEHFVRLAVPQFTDEIYHQALTAEDWTLAETRQLFDLCTRYDMKFHVVYDRFVPLQKQRSLEDLKDRFYTVLNKLAKLPQTLSSTDTADSESPSIPTVSFDKGKEQSRKSHLEKLYQRPLDVINEEEGLVLMIRKLRHLGRSYTRQREHLLQLFAAVPSSLTKEPRTSSSLASGQTTTQGTGESGQLVKKKRRVVKKSSLVGGSTEPQVPPPPIKEEPATVTSPTVPHKREHTTPLLKEASTARASPTLAKKDKPPVGVYLRSAKITPVPSSYANAFTAQLQEFGLSTRPYMPTEPVCEVFEEVQKLILELLEVKRQAELVMTEVESEELSRRPSFVKDEKDESSPPPTQERKRSYGHPPIGSREKKQRPREGHH